ncbi:MAG: glycosyltransferase family 1 protein [Xenococcaceae cyanobacterium MO_188.B19]|nr:glycosyltransferase family 1 protein [Xenococcaceae cyanobacterium MO_188.B19]MDJ0682421.1 glycosyltransferase family 1 protein [Xenococcaceae cyanobacterium MO_167.B52]
MKTIYFYDRTGSVNQLNLQDNLDWTDISQARKYCSGNFTSWILTTYFQIQNSGISCKFIDHIPEKGIVIADRDTLGNEYSYWGEAMLICCKGDREFHPSAHLHIVHNPVEFEDKKNQVWNPYYISHWTQPNLIPRLQERRNIVENIGFMGSRSNFARELKSERWIKALETLGCQWYPIFEPSKWNDYSNIDVVVAVRSFDGQTYNHKPASKVVNSWLAGVIAIVAPESAFMAIRKSELDFLVVNSLDETIESIKYLKNNPKIYLSMLENGRNRAQEFSEYQIRKQWITFFEKYVFIEYEKWVNMSKLQRYYLFLSRLAELKKTRFQNKIYKYRISI